MDLVVKKPDLAVWNGLDLRCATGGGGIVPVSAKTEGDKATPIGRWPMREIIYRADRIVLPTCRLPMRAMTRDDGWCETPGDIHYNRAVKHPYAVPVDQLWRDDHVYDIIVVMGYNDRPVISDKGSAIFLHLAQPNFSPTAGCVALSLDDLLMVVREATPTSCVSVLMTP